MKGKYQKWLEPENLVLVEGWARDGLTDEQIAHNMGCACSTLYDWKNKYPEITEALKNGKETIDYEVENALLKRALGYEYEEVKRETDDDGKTKNTKTVKQVVPDTTAQIFWLKNRRPGKWKNKPEPEGDSDVLKTAKELLEGIDSVID